MFNTVREVGTSTLQYWFAPIFTPVKFLSQVVGHNYAAEFKAKFKTDQEVGVDLKKQLPLP